MNSRKVALYTAVILLVVLAFVFLYLVRNVIFLIFISILLATAIEPLVNWLRRGPFNRGMGILVVYTVIMGVFAGILLLTIPPLIDEGGRIVANLSNEQQTDNAIKEGLGTGFLANIATSTYHSIRGALGDPKTVDTGVSLGLTVFEVLFSFVTVFVIAFYWLTERPVIKRFIFSFVPESRRPRGRLLWDSVEDKLGAWVRGQVILMGFIFAMTLIGYTVMGVKFAFALATFAGLAELIPLVGPYIGGAPAVLLAFTQSPGLALAVAVYIVVIQLVEGNILVPRIMEKAVGVTPLTVIVGILVGSTLYGILGALLAVPIAAAAQVVFNNIVSFGAETVPAHSAVAASSNTSAALSEAARANEMARSHDNYKDEEPPTQGAALI
ncbi:MAG TPA: AI-2E family transporter [Chloroflexia bacterium]|nr:AI-2E family transporter [Chloroflexia bacterium]